ncbi:DUF3810 domain-containing protein [Deminuibacter soli]|nr:DUF3810 domain-containing protein [Deminuibacter soli]
MTNLNVIVGRMKRNYTFLYNRYSLKRTWIRNAVLLFLAILIYLAGYFPSAVEYWYSANWFKRIASIQRTLLGWLPFSAGDLLYISWGLALIIGVIQLFRVIFNKTFTWQWLWLKLSRLVGKLLFIYVFFYLVWGLNYSRLGIAYQLHLDEQPYSTPTLDSITQELLHKTNAARLQLGPDTNYVYPDYQEIITGTKEAYSKLEQQFPFLAYRRASIKPSMFSELLMYMGTAGYYNPFTGEAQVNIKVPPGDLPYITCHEVSHQLGYGDESEANFVGYLAAKAAGNPVFAYSVYTDLFRYANSELYLRDSSAARRNYRALDTLVKIDLRARRRYYLKYKNRAEPVISFFYGQYLKANHQPQGVDTYNAVTGWLVAYRKKYGEL